MSDQFVHLERRDDGVAVVRLDRPKMNALSPELLEQVEAAAKELTADPPGAVVVWGGERLFAAGADISRFGGPEEAGLISSTFARALEALEAIPRATIAAITGYALGGGCELALACDFRVVADNAKLGQPEVLLGIIPGGGGTQRLPRLVGLSRAKDLLYSGRQVDADEALRIGLADRVVPAAEVLDAALAWAGELARGALVAHGLMKGAVARGYDAPLAEGVRIETEAFVASFRTEDAAVGVKSFLENGPGKATFTGR